MNKSVFLQLSVLNRVLLETNSLRTNLNSLLEDLKNQFNVGRSFILLFDEESEKLSPIAFHGLEIVEFRRLVERIDKTIFKQLFINKTSQFIPKLSEEKTLIFLQNPDFDSSLLCLPILFRNK